MKAVHTITTISQATTEREGDKGDKGSKRATSTGRGSFSVMVLRTIQRMCYEWIGKANET